MARNLSVFRELHAEPQPNALGVYSPSAWMRDVGNYVSENLVLSMRDQERRIQLKAARRRRISGRSLRLHGIANRKKQRELPRRIKIAGKRLQMQIRIAERQSDMGSLQRGVPIR